MNLLKTVHLLLNLSMAIGLSSTLTTPVFAAEEISNGTNTIKVSDIEQFAKTGDPSLFTIVDLELLGLTLAVKAELNRPISIDLSKPLTGEQFWVAFFHEMFQLSDEQTNEALKLLAQKANGMTLVEFLKALPGKTITPHNFLSALESFNKPVSPPPISLELPSIGSASGFTLTGSAHQIDSRLRLTNWYAQAGTAFLTERINLAENASFSSKFSFQISSSNGIGDEDGPGADGLAFVIQTLSNNIGGTGGGIGYGGIGQSVAIEFDTFSNKGIDPNGNHIGLNLNGNIYSTAWTPIYPSMNNGGLWYSWVDYNGLSKLLEVRISTHENRPINPVLSYVLDIASILTMPDAFMGFTSGTGGAMGVHDILSWDVKNYYDPINSDRFGINGIKFEEDKTLEFTFTKSQGHAISQLGIFELQDNIPVLVKSLFEEKDIADPEYQAHAPNGVPENTWLGTAKNLKGAATNTFTFLANKIYTLGLLGNDWGKELTPVFSTSSLNKGGFQFAAFGSQGGKEGENYESSAQNYQSAMGLLNSGKSVSIAFNDLTLWQGENNPYWKDDRDFNDFVVSAQEVPEPISIAGMTLGILGAIYTRRRRFR